MIDIESNGELHIASDVHITYVYIKYAGNDVYVCVKYYTLIFRIKGDETSSTTGESSRTSNNRDLSPSTHPVNIIRQEPAAPAGEIIFPDKPAEVTYILTSRLHVKSFNISIYAVAVYFTYVHSMYIACVATYREICIIPGLFRHGIIAELTRKRLRARRG